MSSGPRCTNLGSWHETEKSVRRSEVPSSKSSQPKMEKMVAEVTGSIAYKMSSARPVERLAVKVISPSELLSFRQ